VTEVIVFFFFNIIEAEKKKIAHCRHLFCCNKTKTQVGDGSMAFFTTTILIFWLQQDQNRR
jgi:hypothetical protein